MRGMLGSLIIFLVCLALVMLYIFLGKGQISVAASNLQMQIDEKDSELIAIRSKRNEITTLKASLPLWRQQLEIFTTAIPVKVDDHIFFGNLVDQLDHYPEVKLLSLDSVFGGPWLGKVDEKQEEVLISYNIDVESAKSIRVSFFTLKLLGEFDDVLTIIENLKQYRRLYTIDMIAGPATGGSGAITQSAQPEITPIQVTGRLYFNLPEPKVDVNELTRMYLEVFAGMLQNDMVSAGRQAAIGIDSNRTPPANTNPINDGDAESQVEPADGNGSQTTDDNPAAGEKDENPGDIALAHISGSAIPGL